MKKLALVFALVLSTSLFLSAVAGPIVTLKIRIGKNGSNCANFGFCWKGSSATVELARVANGTDGGTTLQINDITGNLEIIVPASVWQEKADYFNGTSVVFEEAVSLGAKLSSELKAPVDITINPGKYAIQKNRENNVKIIVPLK